MYNVRQWIIKCKDLWFWRKLTLRCTYLRSKGMRKKMPVWKIIWTYFIRSLALSEYKWLLLPKMINIEKERHEIIYAECMNDYFKLRVYTVYIHRTLLSCNVDPIFVSYLYFDSTGLLKFICKHFLRVTVSFMRYSQSSDT